MASQEFFVCDFKHEIITFKTFNIAPNLTLQLPCFHLIDTSKVIVEHHALSTDVVDEILDLVKVFHSELS